MYKLSYRLFPDFLVGVGIFLLLLTGFNLSITIYDLVFRNIYEDINIAIGANLGFAFVGLVLITTRSIITVDSENRVIHKRMKLIGVLMSNEKIKVPQGCNELIAKGKIKRGTGYYHSVIPFGYKIKSMDIYLNYKKRLYKIVSTGPQRGKQIAELLNKSLGINYEVIR